MPDFTFRDLSGQHVDWSDLDDAQRPRLRVVKPEETPGEAPEITAEATDVLPEPVAAPEAVLDAPEHRDGWYQGGGWVDRPKVDPIKGLRAYLALFREIIEREEPRP